MNITKFKSKKITNNEKILITIFISITIAIKIIYVISSSISEAIINTADALIKRENTISFKNAFAKKEKINIDVDNLINVYKNSKGEIVEVNFNIKECEKIMLGIIEEMNIKANEISDDGYVIFIPLGYLTNSPFLLNLGPKIPVKISTTDVALGEVKTEIKEYGINNALVELYINFEIETNAILPLKSGTTKQKYSALIASKIINGSVPNFYNGGILRKSETFNLPIEENM